MACNHDLAEMDTACVADGMCPICLSEQVKALRRALHPFANWIKRVDVAAPGESAIADNRTCLINGDAVITYGDFRAATAALRPAGTETAGQP